MSDPFLFGAATSAHQVEGNNVHSDWWAWEQAHLDIENSGRAADHYHRYNDDFALAKALGHNAHRLSLEWSRIEPKRGQWNKPALDHYREVLQALQRLGLTSFVTLHHFTSPGWFTKAGGWESGRAAELFGRYVTTVMNHVGDLVDFWVTINEPIVYATQSYWRRRWPPQKHSALALARVVRHMGQAHRAAYRILHRHFPAARVGIAKSVIAYRPGEPLVDWWYNHFFYALTRGTHDYLGLNYYFSSGWDRWQGARSDMGWPINPDGLKRILLAMRRYKLPVYVTENGLADARDAQRASFIRAHLRAVEQAQVRGADVRGYLHWSLLDNFEWADGFAPRFGLVAVDYKTMQRTVRPSAYVYKAIIEQSRRQ
jgi:beta-glucosidase